MKPDRNSIQYSGIVYTPAEVANELCRLAMDGLKGKKIRILEPSAGDGAFVTELVSEYSLASAITAIDVDTQATDFLSSKFNDLNVIESDYLEFSLGQESGKYDLIIGNPPYIRRHNYTKSFSENVASLSKKVGFPLSQLKNAWAAFSLASIDLLTDDGVLAFIVPYELITVIYGRALQEKMVEEFDSLDVYIPDEKAFKNIDQDAVIFVGSKKNKNVRTGLQIHRVKNLCDLTPISTRTINLVTTKNLSTDLKSFLLDSETVDLLHKIRENLSKVSDYCTSAAGTVTAANDFFILKKNDVDRLGLQPWARRILKKGSYLSSKPNFKKQDFELLENEQPCYIIDFNEKTGKPLSAQALDYIKFGEELELDQRYKCRNRKPWYQVPIVPVSEGFFFKRSYKIPRLCINEACVLVTDTAYHIRMKKGYTIKELSYSYYNSLTLLFSEIDGRFYGGGVLELTPKEFRGLPIFYQSPTENEYLDFEDRFPKITQNNDTFFGYEDRKLSYEMNLSENDMKKIQNALILVRNHRLRHGA